MLLQQFPLWRAGWLFRLIPNLMMATTYSISHSQQFGLRYVYKLDRVGNGFVSHDLIDTKEYTRKLLSLCRYSYEST